MVHSYNINLGFNYVKQLHIKNYTLETLYFVIFIACSQISLTSVCSFQVYRRNEDTGNSCIFISTTQLTESSQIIHRKI